MASSGWQVTGQLANQVKNTPTNGTVEGTWVFFVTGDGNNGAVFIPDVVYHNRKKTHALIRQEAELIDDIGNMTDASTF